MDRHNGHPQGRTRLLHPVRARIANFRHEVSITQTQLADALGVSQQTVNAYEAGTRRMPVPMLPQLATTFAIAIEALIGMPSPSGKRGPQPKLLQQVERIERLPKSRQRFIMQLIDTALQARVQYAE